MITEPITRETPFGPVTFAPPRQCDIAAAKVWAETPEGVTILAFEDDYHPADHPPTLAARLLKWVLGILRKLRSEP